MSQSTNDKPQGVERRTIIKGAAWSVPAITTAVAAPFASASPICAPGNAAFATPGVYTVEIPGGVSEVTYTIRGAGGGLGHLTYGHEDNPTAHGFRYYGHRNGGTGAETTGVMALTSSATPKLLTVIVGEGGEGGLTGMGTIHQGGDGYGKGGDSSPNYGTSSAVSGGGGGGGSAILVGSVPLVVAGGGGGKAQASNQSGTTPPANTFRWHTKSSEYPGIDANRGDAGQDGYVLGHTLGGTAPPTPASFTHIILPTPATAAVGAVGGAGGGGSHYKDPADAPQLTAGDHLIGGTGGDHGTGLHGGGDGGSAHTIFPASVPLGAAGGGGGGYAGGGGGGLVRVIRNQGGNLYPNFAAVGSGAGGSSYLADGGALAGTGLAGITSAGFSPANWVAVYGELPNITYLPGHSGLVTLDWSCPSP